MSDRSVTLQLATYGRMFAITRQGIINDDLNMFSKVPQKMGRGAKRTIANLVWAQITSNPAMADGHNLFDNTNHFNHDDSGADYQKNRQPGTGQPLRAMAKGMLGSATPAPENSPL
jgi:phage major head subunit gpT-like protein